MAFHQAKDPVAQYERQYAKWQDFVRYAEEAKDAGHEYSAELWRRKARGVRSALTRLAKNAGWQ